MGSIMPATFAAAPTEQMRELGADEDEVRKMSLTHPGVRQRLWGLAARTDPSVTFEEFRYWAQVEREMEEEEYRRFKATTTNTGFLGGIKSYFTSNAYEDAKQQAAATSGNRDLQTHEEKDGHLNDTNGTSPIGPSMTHDYDAEWRTAARALRTAGWASIFYLITTDILGWSATPAVFGATGYGQGVGIFLIMGLAAMASGFMLWRTYIGLDSSRFPMLSYGDPYFRVYGPTARHTMNVLQSLQQFCSVAVIVLGNASLISQLANAKICFVVCIMITMFVGMVSGLLRSLKHLAWICNLAVWLNIASFIIICVAAHNYGPDPTVAIQTSIFPKAWLTNAPPVATFVNTPPAMYQQLSTDLFTAKFASGINQMVYSYSGIFLFVAFMSEMRRPMDFWKAMICAQVFITVVYIFFGAFVYTYYGQYAYTQVSQTVSPLVLQNTSNALAFITAVLAVFLYFNIGMKTIYLEVGQELLRFPPITTTKGKYLWWALGPFYWILAFIVGSSIPQFSSIVGFIGGFLGINFTYSFSAILYLGYLVKEAARQPGEGFDPATGHTTFHDRGLSRYMRGFLRSWYLSGPVLLYALLGLAASGMGTWAAIEGLINVFSQGGSITTSWGCAAPGG